MNRMGYGGCLTNCNEIRQIINGRISQGSGYSNIEPQGMLIILYQVQYISVYKINFSSDVILLKTNNLLSTEVYVKD